jgi:DNA-binding response OmpR family regulator
MNKGKICVVEDDEILLKVLMAELVDAGFDVSSATDGEKGLVLIDAKKPDLVLLDILMPKKNGLEVLAVMKKSPSMQNIPVILLTALGGDEDIKRGFALGATDYIVKSEHAITEIIEKITNFFEKTTHPQAIPTPSKE